MRVVVAALREAGVVVGGLQAAGVQVQRVLEESGAGVAKVRAARPPPARHGAQRRRGHHVAQRQRLLQQRAHLLLPHDHTHTEHVLFTYTLHITFTLDLPKSATDVNAVFPIVRVI